MGTITKVRFSCLVHFYVFIDSFYADLPRIAQADFVPTKTDILRARRKTTGIVESVIMIKNIAYRFFDMGGQRSERRKWLQCFDKVTAMIFVVGMSEYDQVIDEDESRNSLLESLDLFHSITRSPCKVSFYF